MTKRFHKRSTALEQSVNKLSSILEGLNMFNGTRLTLKSDVDQDTNLFESFGSLVQISVLKSQVSCTLGSWYYGLKYALKVCKMKL